MGDCCWGLVPREGILGGGLSTSAGTALAEIAVAATPPLEGGALDYWFEIYLDGTLCMWF